MADRQPFPRTSIDRYRRGFTLIELLVGIAIIGVMSGMVLFTLAGARTDAQRSRTRVTIEKINAVILEKWESYRYRAVKLNIPQSFTRIQQSGSAIVRARDAARFRAILVRDMMRMEMPDRRSDLTFVPTNASFTSTLNATVYDLDDFGGRFPSREYNILRNNFNLARVAVPYSGAIVADSTVLSASRETWTSDRESAECLYAIVAHASNGFGSALEGFHASEIGDVDGDGYPEFIDAWGTPIAWIRWPAAYASKLNESYKAVSPDAFDPFRTDTHWGTTFTQKPWTLVPLVVSAGPDESFGIDFSLNTRFADDPQRSIFMPDTDNPAVGAIVDSAAVTDNVSSHDLLLD